MLQYRGNNQLVGIFLFQSVKLKAFTRIPQRCLQIDSCDQSPKLLDHYVNEHKRREDVEETQNDADAELAETQDKHTRDVYNIAQATAVNVQAQVDDAWTAQMHENSLQHAQQLELSNGNAVTSK